MTTAKWITVPRRQFLDYSTALDSVAIDNSYRQLAPATNGTGVILDLSSATYLPHATLPYLGALFRERALRGQSTQLRLARDPRLFAFLRSWQFPEFLEQATRMPFRALLDEETRDYYATTKIEVPLNVEFTWDPHKHEFTELLPRKHFAITRINLGISPIRAAMSAHDNWREQNLQHVLDRHLGGGGSRVATHVVLEAVLNAARHPGAAMAFTSSRIFHNPDRSPHELELCVWDDGQAISSTLLNETRHGRKIRSEAFGAVSEEFVVELRGTSDRGRRVRILSDTSSTPTTHRLMTALAFLLGVTSTPEQGEEDSSGARIGQLEGDPSCLQGLPYRLNNTLGQKAGLGLYLIRKTVIDQFGGSIEYSTNHYRYRITQGDGPSRYTIFARLKTRDSWPLKGNLFTFHIPLTEDGHRDA